MGIYEKLEQFERTTQNLVFIFLEWEKVVIVQNIEAVAKNLLHVIQEPKGHELEEVVLIKVKFHVFDC